MARIGDTACLNYLNCKTRRGRVGHGMAHTLMASVMSQYTPQRLPDGTLALRRLMPVECERLQGFPDGWTRRWRTGELISDTQRYKMCGNAVTTTVIQAVFERIAECLFARLAASSGSGRKRSIRTSCHGLGDRTYQRYPLCPHGAGGASGQGVQRRDGREATP